MLLIIFAMAWVLAAFLEIYFRKAGDVFFIPVYIPLQYGIDAQSPLSSIVWHGNFWFYVQFALLNAVFPYFLLEICMWIGTK